MNELPEIIDAQHKTAMVLSITTRNTGVKKTV